MVMDITLKDDRFLVVFHKEFFMGEFPQWFGSPSVLADEYAYLGTLHRPGETLGFDGCLVKESEVGDHATFSFVLPERVLTEKERGQKKVQRLCVTDEGSRQFEQFLISIYLLSNYRLEFMHYDKVLFDTDEWKDQSLSFSSIGTKGGNSGRFVGGHMHPWLVEQLAGLTPAELVEVRLYVCGELHRMSELLSGEKACYEQITIENTGWFFQVDSGGRWGESSAKRASPGRRVEFSSHNMDFSHDQRILFASIVAMNTWLRERARKVSGLTTKE